MIKPTTPSSRWHEAGETDPHARYNEYERHELAMGHLTDDEMANAVFLHGNETPRIEQVISGTAKMPIAWLSAAKDRIRWLSRRLQKCETQVDNMAPLIRQLAYKLDKANPGNDLSRRAMVYLANNGFKADLLRKRPGQSKDYEERIEERARSIYESWSNIPGYVPWTVNGNSDRQEEARRLARQQIAQ